MHPIDYSNFPYIVQYIFQDQIRQSFNCSSRDDAMQLEYKMRDALGWTVKMYKVQQVLPEDF